MLQIAKQVIEYTSSHLFLTGKAGTGKTTFLRNLRHDCTKRFVILAPTGIAAINAGGSTIHSFFQFSFSPFVPNTRNSETYKLKKKKIALIKSLDLIVIDEISMVRADLLDRIDHALRYYRRSNRPFGGIQMLMIGDLCQLPPVAKEDEWNLLSSYYESPYFFSSWVLKQNDYLIVELDKVFRQKDEHFIELLNRVRNNTVDFKVLQQLNNRYLPDFNFQNADGYVRLVTHNYQARDINEQKLKLLNEPLYSFQAKTEGNFPSISFPTDEILELKRGAQVMFIKNDMEKRYFNGSLGVITYLDDKTIKVRLLEKDSEIQVPLETWENIKYEVNEKNKEIEEKIEGKFFQYPLRLAWAITVHKSQGLTFEKAIIDVNSAFAHGQTYVALSRCQSLEGMVLSSPLSLSAFISDQLVYDYSSQMNNRCPDDERLQYLSRQHVQMLLGHLFDFEEIQSVLAALVRHVQSHLKNVYPESIAQFSDSVTKLHERVVEVSRKFLSQTVNNLLNCTYKPESPLGERIRKGATYFIENLKPLSELIDSFRLVSDNKEVQNRSNDLVAELRLLLSCKIQLLENVADEGFHPSVYQKQRAILALGDTSSKVNIETETLQKGKEGLLVPTDLLHPQLHDMLTKWRKVKSDELRVPAYVVLQQKALLGISNLLPDNEKKLLKIPHFGKVTLEKYGKEILELVHQYLSKNDVSSPSLPVATLPEKKEPKIKTREVSYRYFLEGMSISDIAKTRQLVESTVLSHLSSYVAEGKITLNQLVSTQKQDRINDYLRRNDINNLPRFSELKAELGEDILYPEFSMVLDEYRLHN